MVQMAVCLIEMLFILELVILMGLLFDELFSPFNPNNKVSLLLELFSLKFALSINLIIPNLYSYFPSPRLTLNMLPLVSKR